MANRYDRNPFDEEEREVYPFAEGGGKGEHSKQSNFSGGPFYTTSSGSAPPASHSRLSPLRPEPADFYNPTASIDNPLDLKKKERELKAKESDLKTREQEVRRREEAVARAGLVIEEKNWPPFFPIIHHDIANEIPIHLQKLQYVAFATFLGLAFSLLWNLVAVTSAWIKEGGWYCYIKSRCKDLVSGNHLLNIWDSRSLCAVVSPSIPNFQERKCFMVWVVFPVLLASHMLLYLCRCGSSGRFQREVSCGYPSCCGSHRRSCSGWGVLLHRFRTILPRVCPQHLGYTASLHVLSGQWQSGGDEA